jgi:hypothetical protein
MALSWVLIAEMLSEVPDKAHPASRMVVSWAVISRLLVLVASRTSSRVSLMIARSVLQDSSLVLLPVRVPSSEINLSVWLKMK